MPCSYTHNGALCEPAVATAWRSGSLMIGTNLIKFCHIDSIFSGEYHYLWFCRQARCRFTQMALS